MAKLRACSASGLRSLLEAQDISGPAADLFKQGVNGADFLVLTHEAFIKDLRLTAFVAKKLVKVRAELTSVL